MSPVVLILIQNRSLTTVTEDIHVLVLPTKQVVPGQGVEDAWGSDEVAHGSGESGGVNPDGDKWVPDVDFSQETVIPLKQHTIKGLENEIQEITLTNIHGSLITKKFVIFLIHGIFSFIWLFQAGTHKS